MSQVQLNSLYLQPPIIYTFLPYYGGQNSIVTIYGENLEGAYVSASPGYYNEVVTPNGVVTSENSGGYFHVTNEYGGWEY